jgi:hypothetical protein
MVAQWPGITDATNFKEAQELLSKVNSGQISDSDLKKRLFGNTGSEFGWLAALSMTDIPIVGTHSHILDVAGHVYSNREEEIRDYYLNVDRMVSTLKVCCNELVIISDHGMEVSALEDENPGKHSWRSFIGTTIEDDLPDTMIEIAPWLENHISMEEKPLQQERLDAPTDHLRDLGYFS